MYKFFFLLLALILFTLGCMDEKKSTLQTINVNLREASLFGEDSIISSIQYIPLETTPTNYLGKISIVKKYKNKIYILTNDEEECALSIFKEDGSFLAMLKKPGEGPGEFTSVSDFIVDDEEETIELYDIDKLAIIQYNFDLSYKGEIKLHNPYEEFVKFKEQHYAVYTGNSDESLKNLVYITHGEEFEKKMNFSLVGSSIEGPHFSTRCKEGNYLVHDSFNDTIYSFSENHNTFGPQFIFNFNGDFVDDTWISEFVSGDMMKKMELMNRSGKVYSFKYLNYADHILLNAFYHFTEKRFYFDFYSDLVNDNYTFYSERLFGVANKFDLGIVPRYLAYRSNNQLVFYIDSQEIIEHIKSIEEQDMNNYTEKAKTRFMKLQKKLKSLTYSDNPVLMVVNLDLEKML